MSITWMAERAVAVISYMISAISTILINKYVLTFLVRQPAASTLTAIQSVAILILAPFVCAVTSYRVESPANLGMMKWISVSILLTLMIYSGANGLKFLSISTFSVLKNVSIVINALVDQFTGGVRTSPCMWASFVMIFLSSYLSGTGEMGFSLLGHLWMATNVVSTSLHTILMKKYIHGRGNNLSPIIYPNMLALPPLVIISIIFERSAMEKIGSNATIALTMLASGVSAMLTCFSTVKCLSMLNSTSFAVVGAINKVVISFSGIIFIGEDGVGLKKLSSIVIGCLGGSIYAFERIRIVKKRNEYLSSDRSGTLNNDQHDL